MVLEQPQRASSLENLSNQVLLPLRFVTCPVGILIVGLHLVYEYDSEIREL
jgi:hypothetical protein